MTKKKTGAFTLNTKPPKIEVGRLGVEVEIDKDGYAVEKKPKNIDWGRIGDPEYLASVTGGKIATDEEVCESFGVEEGKRIYDKFFVIEPNFGDNELLTQTKLSYAKCIEIMEAKNADYATAEDPLKNFRMCEQFGVSTSKGIMIRLSDKITRIGNLLDHEANVKDESIEDTILDACNYLMILYYSLKEKDGHKKKI